MHSSQKILCSTRCGSTRISPVFTSFAVFTSVVLPAETLTISFVEDASIVFAFPANTKTPLAFEDSPLNPRPY